MHAWGGLFKETLSPWACNLFCIRFFLMLQPTGFLGTRVQGRSMRSKGVEEIPLEEGNFAFLGSEFLPSMQPSPKPGPRGCSHPAGASLSLLTWAKFNQPVGTELVVPAKGFL